MVQASAVLCRHASGIVAPAAYRKGERLAVFGGRDVAAFTDIGNAVAWCINPYTKCIRQDEAGTAYSDTLSAYAVPDVPAIVLPRMHTGTGTDPINVAELDACIRQYKTDHDAADRANTEIGHDFSLVARRDIAAGEPLLRHYGADYWWLRLYHASTHPLARLHCVRRRHIIFTHKGKVYTGNNSRNAETMLAYLGIGPDSSYIAELGLARETDTVKINRLIAMII